MIAGSIMIALILLLRTFALKRLPKWLFRALWLLAAARMLLPHAIVLTVKVPAAVRETVPSPMRPVPVTVTEAADGTVQTVLAQTVPWEAVLTAVYLAGVIVIAGFFLFSYARLYRIVRRAEARCLCGIAVRVGEGFGSPFTCGIVKPVIFVPSKLLSLEKGQLECILAHEVCHIRRHDLPAKWLILAAVCIHWWNPMAWLMLRYANRDIELACDEAAAKHSDRAEYALCLIAAEEVRSAAPAGFFGAPAIRERIECIMKRKHLTICSFICAAAILAAATPFFIEIDAAEDDTAGAETSVTDLTGTEPFLSGAYEYEPVVSYEVDGAESAEEVIVEIAAETEKASVEMVFPLKGEYSISQGYSDKHPAVDLAAAKDSDILAVMDGTVITARPDYTLGNYLEIDHGNGMVSVYAHCTRWYVKEGDTVKAGDVIASVGQTGMATGPHMHFAMTADGAAVLPEGLFDPADFPKKPF